MSRARTTISVDAAVLDVYRRLAEVGRVSLSKCIGDWLESTAEGAEHVADKLHSVRGSPGRAMAALNLDLNHLVGSHHADLEGREEAAQRAPKGAPAVRPSGTSPLAVIRGESPPSRKK